MTFPSDLEGVCLCVVHGALAVAVPEGVQTQSGVTVETELPQSICLSQEGQEQRLVRLFLC